MSGPRRRRPGGWELVDILAGEGWLTPHTYSEYYGSIPQTPGIYLFLLLKGICFDRDAENSATVLYVGMATVLARRLQGHEVRREVDDLGFVQTWFKTGAVSSLRAVERTHIQRFDPPYNIIGRRRGIQRALVQARPGEGTQRDGRADP